MHIVSAMVSIGSLTLRRAKNSESFGRTIYSVLAIHYKYIVEVLGKTIRRTMMIDHSFEKKFHGACYRLRFTIFYRLILNKVHDNSKT